MNIIRQSEIFWETVSVYLSLDACGRMAMRASTYVYITKHVCVCIRIC